MKKQCRMKDVLNEVYGLADEARKAVAEGLDREYIHGLLIAMMLKLEREK